MSVPLTGGQGYFTRQGVFIGEYNRVAYFYGSALTAGFQSIWAQFSGSNQAAVQNLPDAVAAFANTDTTYLGVLVSDAQTASVLQVADDVSVVPSTFQRSVEIVIDQMITNSQTVQRPTLTSSVSAAGINLGDATVVVSTTNQYGDPLDMTFAEDVVFTNTSSDNSFASSLSYAGDTAVDPNSPLWPAGSGCTGTMTALDQTQTGIVTDGGFEAWGGTGNNTPTNWDIVNGDAGVTVQRGTSDPVRGSFYAEIVSDGAQATQLAQDITLTVNTVYAVCVYAKISATTATGTFRIALTDGDGNVLTDDAGNSLSYTRNVNGQVSATWAIFTAFFSTPRQLPAVTRVQYGLSVAATSGRVLSLDLAGVQVATQLYSGGPFAAAFSGENAAALGDYWTATFTNSLGSNSFVRGADRLFGFRALGVYYPSASSPTIPDSLVTH